MLYRTTAMSRPEGQSVNVIRYACFLNGVLTFDIQRTRMTTSDTSASDGTKLRGEIGVLRHVTAQPAGRPPGGPEGVRHEAEPRHCCHSLAVC